MKLKSVLLLGILLLGCDVLGPDENIQEGFAEPGGLFGYHLDHTDEFGVVSTSGSSQRGAEEQGAVHIFQTQHSSWDLIQTEQELSPNNFLFGWGVALSDEIIVVGAPARSSSSRPGRAFIYPREGASWGSPEVVSPNTNVSDGFGAGLAVYDDIAAIAAIDLESGDSRGKVYIFEEDEGGVWQPTSTLEDNKKSEGFTSFGHLMDIHEDILVVLHRGRDAVDDIIFVYENRESDWEEVDRLRPNSEWSISDVAVYGDQIAIATSTRGTDDGVPEEQGSVHIFESESGGWSESQQVRASNPEKRDWFAAQVDLDGDFLAVSADYKYEGRGAVYIFENQDSSFEEVSELEMSSLDRGSNFGRAISLNYPTLLVGAPSANPPAGRAFLYAHENGTWALQ